MAKINFGDWKILSRHFRHRYRQGYRYLDHCGEFMVSLEENLDFICTDVKPTGAKMSHPELGIKLELDTNDLTLAEDGPTGDGDRFLGTVREVTNIATEVIQPGSIFYAGFATKLYKSFATEDQVFEASLRNRPILDEELADQLGMTPLYQDVTFLLNSGSYDLQISCMPATFNAVKKETHRSYGFRAPDHRKKLVDRLNAREENRSNPNGYALILEADLREHNPPIDGLERQYSELRKRLEILCEKF